MLLDYQLEGHVKYLQPFAEKFRAVDEDLDGILTENQFKTLLANIGLAEESEKLLEQIDPFDTNIITFSDCVSLFTSVSISQEQVEDGPGHSVSVIEKLHRTGAEP